MVRKTPKQQAQARAGTENYDFEGMDPEMKSTLARENVRKKTLGAAVGTYKGESIASKMSKAIRKLRGK